MRTWWSLSVAATVVMGLAAPASQVPALDAARSRVVVEVGKAGAFSFIAGHPHMIEGPIQGTLSIDPAHPERAVGAFEIRTRDLKVIDENEPPQDVAKVQQTMAGEEVLDVARYPTVTFQSKAIDVRQRRGVVLDLTVTGDLTLHGKTRSIAVPVHAELTSGSVTARGTFSVKQTDYGMKPVSVAGGMVSVKNALTIRFAIVAPLSPGV